MSHKEFHINLWLHNHNFTLAMIHTYFTPFLEALFIDLRGNKEYSIFLRVCGSFA